MLKPAYRNYQSYIRQLNRTATWLPGDILKLGEVGTLTRGRFERSASLSELGIDFSEQVGEPDHFSLSNASRQAVRTDGQVAVGNPVGGELSFDFEKVGQCVLSASQLRHHRIENIGHVCDRIVRFHQLGKWRPEWVVIDQVWTAEFLTVAVAQSAKASLCLTVHVDTAPGLVALSDASLGVEISSRSGDIFYTRGANKSPFFAGRRLRRRPFADNDTRQISTRGAPEETTDVVELHFMDDLMASWSESESGGET